MGTFSSFVRLANREKDNYEEDIDTGIFTVVIGNIRPT